MAILDIQEMATSIYNTVLNLNLTAVLLVGLDAIWCRLLPYDNGEDVIVLEYTLHQYECPKQIKVINNNSGYNIGNFQIDMFGLKNAETLEINIEITTWKQIYGENTMPLQGDFVLIQKYHMPYEVMTASPVYTVGGLITSYKCILGDWKHKASRKESKDFKISIDELTNALNILFGEQISKEVADAVTEVETAYNTTTYVDPIKDFDMSSIVVSDIIGESGNLISSAYYDLSKTDKDIVYNVNAIYDPEVKENHWIYSCWFKCDTTDSIKTSSIKLNGIYLKDKDYWWINITPSTELEICDQITIYRGSVIKLYGTAETKECESGWTIKIPAADCLAASKKVASWWTSGLWKMQKFDNINIFSAYNLGCKTFEISICSSDIIINSESYSRKISLGKLKLIDEWTYLAIDIAPQEIRAVLAQNLILANKKYKAYTYVDETIKLTTDKFTLDSAKIENTTRNLCIMNIRLYENEYALANNYKLDMFSQNVKNASKLILVDNPNPGNNLSFISPIK